MQPLPLHNGFQISLQREEKRVRLIILSGNTEFVCRKESFKNLEQFLQASSARIFKGRLQLFKDNNDVHVEVKGEMIGKINATDIKKYLTAIKAG